ncbi:MAG: Eco57I restriction-modification methylase domain-containing protein [Deltaproteobacteria bacterium]|nr:Eco57I restriction-modification methylase domain-containing protein [Deltaproteobacteria bacterium]
MLLSDAIKQSFSEQDTADKLILPFLSHSCGFPTPDSLDYQAQHAVKLNEDDMGRYDGLYLHGGYPYAIVEAKKYSHDIEEKDFHQARSYAISDFFDSPVPFIVVSNGKDYNFYKKTNEIDAQDGKISYKQISQSHWSQIICEKPGSVRAIITPNQLITLLKKIKEWVYNDLKSLFFDLQNNKYDPKININLCDSLENIIKEREIYVGTTTDKQKQIEFAIQTISLHFVLKILFIKIIEDLSSGFDTPRIIQNFFPKEEYSHIGGVFGYKILNTVDKKNRNKAFRIYVKSKKFYLKLGKDIAQITYEDIFRYGFNIYTVQYGKILKAENYDKFFPKSETLKQIREELIAIDIRSIIIYASSEYRGNVIGDIYGQLIDEELKNSIGAIYTPEDTVEFMVNLGNKFLGRFRSKKIVENSCGSGHFYRKIYRMYVNEVVSDHIKAGQQLDYHQAHNEALEHVLGRDIDPFAIQLTLLGVFLEQLKDNVKASTLREHGNHNTWKANHYIDCQNSLDPITIKPQQYFDFYRTLDPEKPKNLLKSCIKALDPDLLIGNPPYGVKVVEGDHYNDIYKLQSKDSYGYFIANAIERLSEGKRVIFITSSSFLTIKSHLKLRALILDHCKIIRILKLHRSTFPGIDIFPVIIELEKCADQEQRSDNFYQFFDLWQLHPIKNGEELRSVYEFILHDLSATESWPYDKKRIARYKNRQGIININTMRTIFDGLPNLYTFMDDYEKTEDPIVKLKNMETSRYIEFNVKIINNVHVLKLGHIATAKQGLIPPSTREYYRIVSGVRGGAVKGSYIEVDEETALTPEDVLLLSSDEKQNGILVNDRFNEKYFVPLDKSGSSDISGKSLSQYYRPIEFYVNWSREAVKQMKYDKKGRFQGASYYFKKGLSYSDTGIYSPTFRLSHGSVFDQKGSCIFSDYFSTEFLLGLLNSKLIKYFVKVFINHSVSSQVDSIKEIPIAIPTDNQRSKIETIVNSIICSQKLDHSYDYYNKQIELDELIYELYNLDDVQKSEVREWYDRRYPKLRRDIDTSLLEEY